MIASCLAHPSSTANKKVRKKLDVGISGHSSPVQPALWQIKMSFGRELGLTRRNKFNT